MAANKISLPEESNFYNLLKSFIVTLEKTQLTHRTKLYISNRDDLSAIDFWSMICYLETLYPYIYGCIDQSNVYEKLAVAKAMKDGRKKKKLEEEAEKATRKAQADKSVFLDIFDQPCYLLISACKEMEMAFTDEDPNFIVEAADKFEWIEFQLFNQIKHLEVRFWIHITHIILYINSYSYLITLDFKNGGNPMEEIKMGQIDQLAKLRGSSFISSSPLSPPVSSLPSASPNSRKRRKRRVSSNEPDKDNARTIKDIRSQRGIREDDRDGGRGDRGADRGDKGDRGADRGDRGADRGDKGADRGDKGDRGGREDKKEESSYDSTQEDIRNRLSALREGDSKKV